MAARFGGRGSIALTLRSWLALAAALAGCSTYDSGALDERLEAARQRAAREMAARQDAGTAPDAAGAGSGGAPEVPGQPSATGCGDGKVGLFEECDIAIPAGSPGACPTSCPALSECIRLELSGSGCQAECELVLPWCGAADGCCPGFCPDALDPDCSDHCGDGVVQADEGETCEPNSSVAPCLDEDDCDDGDPCTKDLFTGGAYSCNTRCTHIPITTLTSGDGCCPARADANSDSDCEPVCGNGVREAGEECDGSLGCSADCRLTTTPEQVTCLDLVEASGGNECDRCTCRQCPGDRLACEASGDAARDQHCSAVIACANANDCAGAGCYCGDSRCWTPGPCRDVIAAARDADPSGGSVTWQSADPNTALGRASIVGECKARHCADVCP